MCKAQVGKREREFKSEGTNMLWRRSPVAQLLGHLWQGMGLTLVGYS